MIAKSESRLSVPVSVSKAFDKQITLFGKTFVWPQVIVGIIFLGSLIYVLRGSIIASTVNGSPIFRLSVIRQLEKQAGSQVLDSMISEILIKQQAAKKNISVTPLEVKAQFESISKQLKSQGQNIDTVIKTQGLTRTDVNKQLEVQLLVEKLTADQIKVTDKEIDAYIEQNKDFFDTLKEGGKRTQAKEQLKKQKVNQAAINLIEKLRKDATIMRLVNY